MWKIKFDFSIEVFIVTNLPLKESETFFYITIYHHQTQRKNSTICNPEPDCVIHQYTLGTMQSTRHKGILTL